jgi:hypothetical protein
MPNILVEAPPFADNLLLSIYIYQNILSATVITAYYAYLIVLNKQVDCLLPEQYYLKSTGMCIWPEQFVCLPIIVRAQGTLEPEPYDSRCPLHVLRCLLSIIAGLKSGQNFFRYARGKDNLAETCF